MWVQRTPEEVANWRSAARKRGRSDGLMIGVMAWIIAVMVLSAGWFVDFKTGVVVEHHYAGTFWTRLPFLALLGSPIIFIAGHFGAKRALRNEEHRTLCPKCEELGKNNAGATCACGGTFILARELKWVEGK
jgi:hypothetical protein